MDVYEYLHNNRDRHLKQLSELLRIPSISTQEDKAKDIRRAATWIKDRMQALGCTRTVLFETKKHPIVYGEWLGAPGKPTVLAYGHYDVQPPEPLEEWRTAPFEPTVRDGKIFARGASDDKGQFCIYLNALEAFLATTGKCPINVKLIIEGEEEIGSGSLMPFLIENKELLACDAIAVSDTEMFARNVPSLTYGLRGLAYLQVDLVGTSHDLHSGSFGGAVKNPAAALCELLAGLKDKNGKVLVPKFYDKVRKLTAQERKAFASLPHKDTHFKKSIGAPELFGEAGFTTLERLWVRPTLEINGLWSGYTGAGAKTVIPAEAHAKISMRLVPDQSPVEIAKLVTAHIKKIAPKSVKVSVQNLHGGDAWIAPTTHPAVKAAGRAFKKAFGKDPVFIREGGSIPIVNNFEKELKAPCVLMGIGLPDDNLHAPNEKLDLENFYRGMTAAANFFEELGSSSAEIADKNQKTAVGKRKTKNRR